MGGNDVVVAGWVLEEHLGRGASGEVWRARRRHVDIRRALKLVRLAGDDEFAAWRHEIVRLESLSHPNIVRFYDADTVAEGPYRGYAWIATELCDRSLADELKQRSSHRLGGAECERLVDEMLQALAAARAGGVVHRDVKPGNILRHPSGAWKLADFGTARLVGASASHPQTGVIGTPPYMSPQAYAGVQDHAADLYALGVTLHECLSGRRLHDRTATMSDGQYVEHLLHDPPTIDPTLPPHWRTLIEALIGHYGPLDATALAPWFTTTRASTPPQTGTRALAPAPAQAPGQTVRPPASVPSASPTGPTGPTGPTVGLPGRAATVASPTHNAPTWMEPGGPTPAGVHVTAVYPAGAAPAPMSPGPMSPPVVSPRAGWAMPPVAYPPWMGFAVRHLPDPVPPPMLAQATMPVITQGISSRRTAAWAIDSVLQVLAMVLLYSLVVIGTGDRFPADAVKEPMEHCEGRPWTCSAVESGDSVYVSDQGGMALLAMLLLPAVVQVVLQGVTGWTPGKLLLGLRLVRADGRPPGILRSFVRGLGRTIDLLPGCFPLVGLVMLLSTDGHRTVADNVANTWVIRRS